MKILRYIGIFFCSFSIILSSPAYADYDEITDRNCSKEFDFGTGKQSYDECARPLGGGYYLNSPQLCRHIQNFVSECKARGFWHSQKPADPRYKDIWVGCIAGPRDRPTRFAFWHDDQGPKEMDVSSGGSSGTRLSDGTGIVKRWKAHIAGSAAEPRCYGFDNAADHRRIMIEGSIEYKYEDQNEEENLFVNLRRMPDRQYTYEQARELYLASNRESISGNVSRNQSGDEGSSKGYGYCTFQYQIVTDPSKARAFVSDVFSWNFQKGESPNRAWDAYLAANYGVTGFGECFHNFNTKTHDETITERDRAQAQFRSIYKNVIATGWRWRGNNGR